jgi:simple sugar transport system substrate-binding protein
MFGERKLRGRIPAALIATMLALAACGGTTPSGGSGAPAAGGPAALSVTIYVVGCAAPTGFHGYIARASAEAGANLGAKVVYIYPDKLTIPNQVQKIEEAILAKPNGIVICAFAEDSAYKDAIEKGKAQGIIFGSNAAPPPNSGALRDPNDIFLTRVGSDEYQAGVLTGKRLLSMGVKGRVMVGDQQPGDATCKARADGEIAALKDGGVTGEFVELTLDPGQQAETITNYLRAHTDTAAATSICDVVDGFLTAKTQANRTDLILTGYDIVSKSLQAIRDGTQSFTIDQQQFWRGYMSVALMIHYIRYGLVQANYFLTGPSVVDKSNVDQVAKLVEAGYR